jgi:uncharacterized RDD family membrane protein YckC
MKCPCCGAMIDSDSVYCGNCGANLGIQSPAVTQYTEYAGFWRRVAASLLDGLILLIPSWIVGFVWGLLLVALGVGRNRGDASLVLVSSYALGLIGVWLYCALMESSASGATLGKQALRIRVITQNAEQLSFAQASGRHFGKILSGLILGIGYIMAGVTEHKQALHDMMAGCLVVRDPR